MQTAKRWWKHLGMRGRIVTVLVMLGMVAIGGFAIYSYRTASQDALTQAQTEAGNLIERSAAMFLVSTRKFHDEFSRAAGDRERRARILQDWNRTIFAVDEAVISDHGETKPRVKLTGDKEIYGYPPSGTGATKIDNEFERMAAVRLAKGEPKVETVDADYLRVAIPLKSQSHRGCAECHFATHEGDQSDMTRDIVLGSLNAYVPLKQALATAHRGALASTGFAAGIIAMLIVAVSFFLTNSVVGPIKRAAAALRDIAQGEGDLTRRLEVRSEDEVGQLAKWFNQFVEKIQTTIRQITGNASTLAGASTELSATATQLAGGAERTTTQSTSTAHAASEMSESLHRVAASTEEMSGSMKSVSMAVEQLTSSISEVARSAEEAAGVANSAAELAETSNAKIGELSRAADEIGKVIEVIQDIAEQTNLLALNATIEAARAGDAGKGFAVVATEVKELAKQTAGATEDIRRRIEGIQTSSSQTVKLISDIGEVIGKVSEVSRTIASAVEEQSVTTKQIAGNVAHTTGAAETVARDVVASASVSQKIAQGISAVDEAARQSAIGAGQTQSAGRELSELSEQLRGLCGQFKI